MQVECSNVIPLAKQDKQLLDKLYAERSGIVHKAVIALKQVIQNGYVFSEPESVAAARKTYMEENNTVIAFFQECIVELRSLRSRIAAPLAEYLRFIRLGAPTITTATPRPPRSSAPNLPPI